MMLPSEPWSELEVAGVAVLVMRLTLSGSQRTNYARFLCVTLTCTFSISFIYIIRVHYHLLLNN